MDRVRALAALALWVRVVVSVALVAPSVLADKLELRTAISQFGIRWTFDKNAPVGQFVNGDYYVVGPVTIASIDPAPVYAKHNRDFGARNGSVLNLPAQSVCGSDGRVRNHFRANLMARLPIEMKPGDSLLSTISGQKGQRVMYILKGSGSTHTTNAIVRTAAVLTCMAEQPPKDAFRPAFCDRTGKTYLARDLKRSLLPSLTRPKSTPPLPTVERYFERPWADTATFGFASPIENMPAYGREFARVVSIGSLMLCCDFAPEEKEALLIRFVQLGIDLWGMVEGGHPGWPAHGGHHSGRKWPMIFAGLMLGDERMAAPTKTYPKLLVQEDMQTMYGKSWTGADVVYAGHVGAHGDRKTKGWGAFEHLHPSRWEAGLGESYRRCCTSLSWVGEALACRLLDATENWDHPAFFDYVDRWMEPDHEQLLAELITISGQRSYAASWARQGQAWDIFVEEMWRLYRYRKPSKP